MDAHDGFDTREEAGDERVDDQLASQANNLSVSGKSQGQQRPLQGIPVQVKDPKDITVSASSLKGDMIPAIANLHQPASFEETSAEDTTNILKRRTPDLGAIKETGRVKQALLQFGQEDTTSRKDQAEPSLQGSQLKRFKQVDTCKQDLEDMEATNPGAASKLAGPTMGSRQEQ